MSIYKLESLRLLLTRDKIISQLVAERTLPLFCLLRCDLNAGSYCYCIWRNRRHLETKRSKRHRFCLVLLRGRSIPEVQPVFSPTSSLRLVICLQGD
jgi:hypothetical protein